MGSQDQRCRRHQNISTASVWYQLLCVALFWAWFRTRRIETSPHNLLHPLSITMRKYFNQKYFMQLPGWCWSWTWVRCWETWNSKSMLDVVECHQTLRSWFNCEILICICFNSMIKELNLVYQGIFRGLAARSSSSFLSCVVIVTGK